MKYFTLDEFRCTHCGELPKDGMHPVLLQKLDELRAKMGCPIYVSSGYRCDKHNDEIGGVKDSQHTKGTAADIYIDGSNYALYLMCCAVGFDGIGYYPVEGFVHVDVRDGGDSPNWYQW